MFNVNLVEQTKHCSKITQVTQASSLPRHKKWFIEKTLLHRQIQLARHKNSSAGSGQWTV